MFLIFTLGRKDVLATGDYGLRTGLKILDNLEELPKPKEFQARAEIWKPFRSVAGWYLWRNVDIRAVKP
ncbi:MAG: hypothetical protein HN509_16750 [Halobacteriovoraceae bacterium]|jgi:DNA-3-methyladenine glycosylase II|nr:hypothetical protein [Halobacteriovoraceae bacterium]MBT5093631.1 hypothetical protein [Halobacteriovoraceae bacterium]